MRQILCKQGGKIGSGECFLEPSDKKQEGKHLVDNDIEMSETEDGEHQDGPQESASAYSVPLSKATDVASSVTPSASMIPTVIPVVRRRLRKQTRTSRGRRYSRLSRSIRGRSSTRRSVVSKLGQKLYNLRLQRRRPLGRPKSKSVSNCRRRGAQSGGRRQQWRPQRIPIRRVQTGGGMSTRATVTSSSSLNKSARGTTGRRNQVGGGYGQRRRIVRRRRRPQVGGFLKQVPFPSHAFKRRRLAGRMNRRRIQTGGRRRRIYRTRYRRQGA